jgi:hypothetical protein
VIFMDHIAASAKQAVTAPRAEGVFILPDLPRQIARVDEAQSRFTADIRGA